MYELITPFVISLATSPGLPHTTTPLPFPILTSSLSSSLTQASGWKLSLQWSSLRKVLPAFEHFVTPSVSSCMPPPPSGNGFSTVFSLFLNVGSKSNISTFPVSALVVRPKIGGVTADICEYSGTPFNLDFTGMAVEGWSEQ